MQAIERLERTRMVGVAHLAMHGQAQRAKDAAAHDLLGRQVHAHLFVHGRAHNAKGTFDIVQQGALLPAKAHGRLVAIQRENFARE